MRVLLLNQAFHPDVVSTAQHTTDLALALVERGHEVTVIASTRAYDSPSTRYPLQETWKGIEIRRIWATGFGKGAKWRRLADFSSFSLSCAGRLFRTRRHDVVVALTSPPWISFLAALLVRARGGRLVYWVMDLNPDAAIAAGWLKPSSAAAGLLERMSLFSLRSASTIIALDRFMAKRIEDKGIAPERITVLPPWAHTDSLQFDPAGRDEFRARHGLEGKFVVMYSGNHSPVHPLTTLLEAALRLREDSSIVFCFIGGGSEFRRVQAFALDKGLGNIVCLPYQPLSGLSASLSAADLHTVVMGNDFVGIVHPCKVYNILALGTPFLYVGPLPSHVGDLTDNQPTWAYLARHGEVDTVVGHIQDAARRRQINLKDEQMAALQFSQDHLLPPHLAVVEEGKSPEYLVAAGQGIASRG